MARNLKVARNLKSAHLGEAGFGLEVMLFGMLVAVLTTNIPIGPAYSAVGPRVLHWLVFGALLVVCLMLLIVSTMSTEPSTRPGVAWRGIGIARIRSDAQLLALTGAGF